MNRDDLLNPLKEIRQDLSRLERRATPWIMLALGLVMAAMDIGERHYPASHMAFGVTAGFALLAYAAAFVFVYARLRRKSPRCANCGSPVYNLDMERACLAVARNTCPECFTPLLEAPADSLEAPTVQRESEEEFLNRLSYSKELSRRRAQMLLATVGIPGGLLVGITLLLTTDLSFMATAIRAAVILGFCVSVGWGTVWHLPSETTARCPVCNEGMTWTALKVARTTGHCGLCGARLHSGFRPPAKSGWKAFLRHIPPLSIKIGGAEIPVWPVALVMTVVLAILAGCVAAYAWWTDVRIEHFMASAKSDGYQVSLPRLAPPTIPASENAAPYYKAGLLLYMYPSEFEGWLDFEPCEGDPFTSLSSENKAFAARFLERNRTAFELVRKGRALAKCRYERNYAAEVDVPYPEAEMSTGPARWIALRAQAEAAAGRHDEARECIKDVYALADAFKDEPILISQLVRLAIHRTSTRAAGFCVTADFPREELVRWLEALPLPGSLGGSIDRGMRGHFAAEVQFAYAPSDFFEQCGEPHAFLELACKSDSVAPLRRLQSLAGCCLKTYPGSRNEAESLGADIQRSGNLFDFVRLRAPRLPTALDTEASAESILAVVRTGIESEIHRIDTGKYPDTVTTIDPCTGKPLVYDPAAGTISSCGPPGSTPEDLERDDLVWKLRHR